MVTAAAGLVLMAATNHPTGFLTFCAILPEPLDLAHLNIHGANCPIVIHEYVFPLGFQFNDQRLIVPFILRIYEFVMICA